MATLVIRAFVETDFAEVDAIRRAAFAPVFASFRSLVGAEVAAAALTNLEAEQQAHLRAICRPHSGYEMHVGEEAGAVRGFVSLSVERETLVGEIGLNAIHPDHQGRGIGTRLFTFALERMRQQGMRAAVVSTGGDASHAPARRAYRKAGFEAAIPGVHLYRRL